MNGKWMTYVAIAAGAAVVGMMVAGTSLTSLLPVLFVLACPLMMLFMMRGMHIGHAGQSPTGHNSTGQHDECTRQHVDDLADREWPDRDRANTGAPHRSDRALT